MRDLRIFCYATCAFFWLCDPWKKKASHACKKKRDLCFLKKYATYVFFCYTTYTFFCYATYGRIPATEDAWLYNKWKTEVDVDSLLQATLPPSPVENEVDRYEALVLTGRMSGLSNEAPSLFDEEDSPPRVGEPFDAGTPEPDAIVPVTPSKVAEPLYSSISEEEDTAIPVSVA